jgi:tRNA A-37 threonylcarbamoyl transferase component Bud32
MPDTQLMTIGSYCGLITKPFHTADVISQLTHINTLLKSNKAETLSHGADKVIKVPLTFGSEEIIVTIKVFKRQGILKDWHDHKHKSKAERSFRAAVHLQKNDIGTPAPIAWLEQWQGKRLLESYYVCAYEPAICWRDALSDIYYNLRDNQPLLELLQVVAPAVRAMHDSGFMHGDMGNQNILLPKNENDQWGKPVFIDLNRAQIEKQPISAAQRAFDLSRIALPGAYLKIFKFMYSFPNDIPTDLDKLEQGFRQRFELHTKTRKYRRPIRFLKRSFANRNSAAKPVYPESNNIWLWDEKSAQPMTILERREKNRYRNLRYAASMAWHSLIALPGIIKRYRQLLQQSYQKSINMQGRIGVALHPKAEYIQQELALLNTLGNPPVLIRFYHHETAADWQQAIELIEQLREKNITVMVALLQDRRALLEPKSWENFLNTVISAIADKVSHIEVTHALNRVKWGIWTSTEYRQLMQPAFALRKKYPNIKLTGPACIDFEYHPTIAALTSLDKNQKLDALSHLLYVDRRGAPENKQGAFSTLEKSALLKALAQQSKHTHDHVIISEVNWPIKNTGIWSPIGCPYETPKWLREQPGETDDDYANYMLRFLAITLCSGHVEQVFWWRLSAHGYGLVDDLNQFKPRPAFTALAFFLQLLGDATFTKKHVSSDEVYLLEFTKGADRLLMAWSTTTGTQSLPLELVPRQGWDAYGQPIETPAISATPSYYLLAVPIQ